MTEMNDGADRARYRLADHPWAALAIFIVANVLVLGLVGTAFAAAGLRPGGAMHHTVAHIVMHIGSVPGPKIVVVQDLYKPNVVGAFWGEVNSSMHKALGCVGTIIDGGIRDLDEMRCVGFKALARKLCVRHAHSHPVRWNWDVEVFGRTVSPGRLIHADKHGFLVIPPEDHEKVLEAARFMDTNECRTMIAAARDSSGMSTEPMLDMFDSACREFSRNTETRFG